jgi:hypothetical protein
MSTCARCGGALTSGHVCHGAVISAVQWTVDIATGGLIGAAAGVLLFDHLVTTVTGESYLLVGLAAGPAAGIAIARTLRKLGRGSGQGFPR